MIHVTRATVPKCYQESRMLMGHGLGMQGWQAALSCAPGTFKAPNRAGLLKVETEAIEKPTARPKKQREQVRQPQQRHGEPCGLGDEEQMGV